MKISDVLRKIIAKTNNGIIKSECTDTAADESKSVTEFTHLTKFEKMMFGVNVEGIGLEIGPSHSPLVPKRDGYEVEILDHATAEELHAKYKELGIPEDKLNNIEVVDYVWSGEAMDELTGKRDYYDYIVASHVVEHTPDLVSFLSQCEAMLKPGGVLSVAVPDKRYCFDFLRPNTTTGGVMQAYYDKRICHTPGVVFDHFSTVAFRNGCHTWEKDDSSPLTFVHELDEAMVMAEKARLSNEYIDVHNWVFVPQSFRLILNDLNSVGLINLSEDKFFDTEGFEFYVLLRKDKDRGSVDRMAYAKSAAGIED